MNLTTADILTLLDNSSGSGDTDALAILLRELIPYWTGPLYGRSPEVRVWLSADNGSYGCELKIMVDADDSVKPGELCNQICDQLNGLIYESDPLFKYGNVVVNYYKYLTLPTPPDTTTPE